MNPSPSNAGPRWYERPRVIVAILAIATAAGLIPMWSVQHQPAVDFPEHLFLIHVLGTLRDPEAFFSNYYVARNGFTYLTVYHTTRLLSSLMSVESAFKIWLTIVLGAIPFSLALLLHSLKKSPWLALLAIPLLYTDGFYWGFVSFFSSIPFMFLTIAFFVRALEDTSGRWWNIAGFALSFVLLQLTHVACVLFPGLVLPVLLVTTSASWKQRARVMIGLVPTAAIFLAWLLFGVHQDRQVGQRGDPWTVSGSPLDRDNWNFTPIEEKWPQGWDLLGGGFHDNADRAPLRVWAILWILTLGFALAFRIRDGFKLHFLRPYLVAAIAAGCFVFLPFEIIGYMSPLYTRYAQVAALASILVLSLPTPAITQSFIAAAVLLSVYSCTTLTPLFRAFDQEASEFEAVAARIEPNSRVMHLIMDTGSRVSSHPAYLHYTALAALRSESFPSFSQAIDPSFPVGYRNGLPPAPRSEWQPQAFNWEEHAVHYNYFLIRGMPAPAAQSLFGVHASEVDVVTSSGNWVLLRRTAPAVDW